VQVFGRGNNETVRMLTGPRRVRGRDRGETRRPVHDPEQDARGESPALLQEDDAI
jgi:hypothetical protein